MWLINLVENLLSVTRIKYAPAYLLSIISIKAKPFSVEELLARLRLMLRCVRYLMQKDG